MGASSEHAWDDGGESVRAVLGSHPAPAARLLQALPGVTDVGGLPSYLDRVVEAARAEVPGCDAAGVTVLVDGLPTTAAYTDQRTLRVDADQYAAGEGPCLDSCLRRVVNLVDVAEAHARWPEFAEAAERDGIRSFLALPLTSGAEGEDDQPAYGALNLYGYAADAFAEASVGLARLLAERAAQALRAARQAAGAELVAAQLREAMEHRAVIEQAKGALMLLRKVEADEAFELLAAESQRRNVKLRVVAQELVARVSGRSVGVDAPPGTGRG